MRNLIPFLKKPPVVPVIPLAGVIGTGGRLGSALNDAALAPIIDRAFTRGKPAAVAIVVNSPGGSPVQSSLIAARIRRLSEEKNIPVHAFVEDVAASGGYWLACAADHIWADRTSIVGSIGVIFASFGFPELMARQGIERRVVTAGKSKSLADPFQPQKPEDIERLKALQTPIHEAFIDHVKARRGERLDLSADLFNADVWTGEQAQTLGLIDGIAHLVPKMKELYGGKVRLRVLGKRRSLLQRLGAAGIAGELAGGVMTAVEERGIWSRYGL
ncbi:MAG: S49 family peptidase [Pseudorhodobacter sp.]